MAWICLSDKWLVQGQGTADQRAAKECFLWEDKLSWIPVCCIIEGTCKGHSWSRGRNNLRKYAWGRVQVCADGNERCVGRAGASVRRTPWAPDSLNWQSAIRVKLTEKQPFELLIRSYAHNTHVPLTNKDTEFHWCVYPRPDSLTGQQVCSLLPHTFVPIKGDRVLNTGSDKERTPGRHI